MHVLDANELFWITSYTYDRIMEEWWKNWPDAFALYFRLMKQARIQQTNQTWSLNEFLQKSMGRWKDRLQNAKKVLNDLWLIDYVQLREWGGKFWTQFIRVNYLIDEQKVRTNSITYDLMVDQLTEIPADDKTETNALNTKIGNALSTKTKINESGKIPTPSELVEAYKNTPQLVEKIKDEWVVRQRAEYKQKKKSKAYKTISWFIQQLVENVTIVSNWEIRYDVWERLRYAQNKAIDWDNLWIRRDERMERWFATWKKFNSLTQKQNE